MNVLIALSCATHVHHSLVKEWFYFDTGLRWATCAFTEAGFLRIASARRPNQLPLSEASKVLDQLAQHPGHRYLPITANWRTLTEPFSRRLHGHNQVTDAYLLGLALREGMVLVTLDKGILHMAGGHRDHVLMLGEEHNQ